MSILALLCRFVGSPIARGARFQSARNLCGIAILSFATAGACDDIPSALLEQRTGRVAESTDLRRIDAEKRVEDFTARIDSSPKPNSEDFEDRADAFMELGEFEKALKDYSRAIVYRNPRAVNSALFKKRVTAAIKAGKYRQALDDVKGLTRISEAMPDAYAMLAIILARSPDKSIKDPEAALDAARFAAKIDTEPRRHEVLVELALAAAYSANREFKQAIIHQEAAIAAMKGNPSLDAKAQLDAYKTENEFPFQINADGK